MSSEIVNVYPVPIQLLFNWDQNCVGPENIHTPPTEGIESSWGCSQRPKYMYLLNVWSSTGISREVGGGGGGAWGSKEKSLSWGGGMDSFWNHTDPSMSMENYVDISTWLHVHLDFNSYAVGKGLTKTDIKKMYFQERVL